MRTASRPGPCASSGGGPATKRIDAQIALAALPRRGALVPLPTKATPGDLIEHTHLSVVRRAAPRPGRAQALGNGNTAQCIDK